MKYCFCNPTSKSIMCSLENVGNVYVMTLTGDGEHRLSLELLDSIQSALGRVRSEVTAGSKCSALITTAQGKFFSNGFDLDTARPSLSSLRLLTSKLRSVLIDLITLPLPTIAAVTGHAAAPGVFLALGHDYVMMRRDRGILYVSELDLGITIPSCFQKLMERKVVGSGARRRLLLRAEKVKAGEAVEMGVVDSAHDGVEGTVEAAVRLGEELVGRKWDGEVYGRMRANMMEDVLDSLVRYDQTTLEGKRSISKL